MKFSSDFKVGEMVMFLPNGLMFKCENMKQWKWMQDVGLYKKIVMDELEVLTDDQINEIRCSAYDLLVP